jgi:hypothetical protein
VSYTPVVEALVAGVPRGAIDWDKVRRLVGEQRGLALPITPRSPSVEEVLKAAPVAQR